MTNQEHSFANVSVVYVYDLWKFQRRALDLLNVLVDLKIHRVNKPAWFLKLEVAREFTRFRQSFWMGHLINKYDMYSLTARASIH